MKLRIKYRDSKGRFTKFNPNIKLSKEVFSSSGLVGRKTARFSKEHSGFSGLQLRDKSGKRLKVEVGEFFERAPIFFEGIHIFNLRSKSQLSSKELVFVDDILEDDIDINFHDEAEELYPSNYLGT